MTGRRIVVGLVALVAATIGSRPAVGQEAATAGGQAGRCTGEAYRSFDFWLGEWEVRVPSGQVAGRNRITAILNGCAIKEEWSGTQGSIGTSYTMWDAASRRWHQTWVDNQGLLLLLDGGISGGKMVLRGQRPGANGAVVGHVGAARGRNGETTLGVVDRRWGDLEGRVRRYLPPGQAVNPRRSGAGRV